MGWVGKVARLRISAFVFVSKFEWICGYIYIRVCTCEDLQMAMSVQTENC